MLLLLLIKVVMDVSLQVHAALCFPAPLGQGWALWMIVCVTWGLEHLSASSRPIKLPSFFSAQGVKSAMFGMLQNTLLILGEQWVWTRAWLYEVCCALSLWHPFTILIFPLLQRVSTSITKCNCPNQEKRTFDFNGQIKSQPNLVRYLLNELSQFL